MGSWVLMWILKPLTFELSAAGAGPPAGSAPYPVQALMQLHDAQLVPGLAEPNTPQTAKFCPVVALPAGHQRDQRTSLRFWTLLRRRCSDRFPLHCYLLCMSPRNLTPPPKPQRVIAPLKCDAPAGGAAPGEEGTHALPVFLWWSDFIHNLKRISQRRSVTIFQHFSKMQLCFKNTHITVFTVCQQRKTFQSKEKFYFVIDKSLLRSHWEKMAWNTSEKE